MSFARAAVPIEAERPGSAQGAADTRRTIPFDYAFGFELLGVPDHVVKSTVTVSIESEFVATSIGYGLAPRASSFVFGLQAPRAGGAVLLRGFFNLGDITAELDARFKDPVATDRVLSQGVRINPEVADAALTILRTGAVALPPDIASRLFQSVGAPPEEIQFRYALYDDGTGREFQSAPLLNTAGLGISTGERPFRHFAAPIRFSPRSTIRLEITEVSEFAGDLQVVLHGYKVLGGLGSPTASGRPRRARRRWSP